MSLRPRRVDMINPAMDVSEPVSPPGEKRADGKKETTTPCSPVDSVPGIIWRLFLCAMAGVIFGWAMEKSRVFEPYSIRCQMVFQRWIMLKMFLAAMASGQLALALMSVIPVVKERWSEANLEFAGCFRDKGLLTNILGPLLLGVGATLSGACPGMVLAQVGSWTENAVYTLLGVLLGALVYGLLAPYLVQCTKPKNPFKIKTVYEQFRVPFIAVAFPVSILLATTVLLLELFIPWQDDLDPIDRNSNTTNNVILLRSWPPSLAGVLIGLLQIVIVLAVGDTLGGSTSYVTLMSQWVVGNKLSSTFPYLAKYRCGIGNWWQVVFVCTAMVGACLSALSSDSLNSTRGVHVAAAVCGGFILMIGARLGAGCTSGHGLSGAGLLYWLSWLAVPGMFAGGVSTGFVLQAAGLLDGQCSSSATLNATRV